jgi:hypothetical protein
MAKSTIAQEKQSEVQYKSQEVFRLYATTKRVFIQVHKTLVVWKVQDKKI